MTELRKKIQTKLRRKYGYSTNTNYGRGMMLIKPPQNICYGDFDYLNISYDFCNVTPENGDIQLYSGSKYLGGFTFEEFELIYQTVKDFHEHEVLRK